MDKEQFLNQLSQLVVAGAELPPYTCETPKSNEEICNLFAKTETASETLTVVSEHMRELLTAAKEPFIGLLEKSFQPKQLTDFNIHINPEQQSAVFSGFFQPYLLVNKSNYQLDIDQAPTDLAIYANTDARIKLTNGGAMIYGQSACILREGEKYEAFDFSRVVAGRDASCYCTDYSVGFGKDHSRLTGAGFSTLVKQGNSDIQTCQSARLIVTDENVDYKLRSKFTPVVKKSLPPTVHIGFAQFMDPDTRQTLALPSGCEQEMFVSALSDRPSGHPCFSTKAPQGKYSDWELRDLFDSALQSKDMERCEELENVTTREELTAFLAENFETLLPFLGIDLIRQEFDHDLLAKYQIFVDDQVQIITENLKGEFYVFGNHIVNQPSCALGNYYEHTIGHVLHGTAYFYDNSVGIGEQAQMVGCGSSLLYGKNVHAYLTDRSVGSLHGDSLVKADLNALVYLHNQTQGVCAQEACMILFDDAKVNEAKGGIIYGDSRSLNNLSGNEILHTDKVELELVRSMGFPLEELRKGKQIQR